ncbi:type II toxin-antitoxin system RelE/ParE family toxin [Sulfurimonas sp.]|jgi:mRNA-degrading endonuclease RelE of RelBE toxin-antitoxin system|uniref:type II toxin-antitoxin system RelE/ParE family toxin n=1 Tax=Sulfurimonas sp. TaxID=2022749 RepID=UPI0025EFABE9|nr:type II toxin-antitoxin system RelE/ParE family toxin [Sulfurimonas sp.]MCK9473080.1 type II toxin-antitoxin system RelE/ParE family toxin [Sulfurimonas sp.]MDD3505752.1 type II toxin-antitoxin system RelE/ParE family toxin [Sulfurimonas sp.]
MNYSIIATPQFAKSVKKLSKKYKLIKNDLILLQDELQSSIDGVELGNSCYKIRVANSSIPTGKRGGFRVVYYKKIKNIIYLLEIYTKSELENISDDKILQILKENNL